MNQITRLTFLVNQRVLQKVVCAICWWTEAHSRTAYFVEAVWWKISLVVAVGNTSNVVIKLWFLIWCFMHLAYILKSYCKHTWSVQFVNIFWNAYCLNFSQTFWWERWGSQRTDFKRCCYLCKLIYCFFSAFAIFLTGVILLLLLLVFTYLIFTFCVFLSCLS